MRVISSFAYFLLFEKKMEDKRNKICGTPELSFFYFIFISTTFTCNNDNIQLYVDSIYPGYLGGKKGTTECSTSTWYLDFLLKLDADGKLTTQLCYKLHCFNFSNVNFPYLCSNILPSYAYVFISHLFDMQKRIQHTISFFIQGSS
jgi:hypothetical protein